MSQAGRIHYKRFKIGPSIVDEVQLPATSVPMSEVSAKIIEAQKETQNEEIEDSVIEEEESAVRSEK